jgi:protocatechuate 3,4-dioxygenase beta subunit
MMTRRPPAKEKPPLEAHERRSMAGGVPLWLVLALALVVAAAALFLFTDLFSTAPGEGDPSGVVTKTERELVEPTVPEAATERDRRPPPEPERPPAGSVTGRIVDASLRPVDGARIRLLEGSLSASMIGLNVVANLPEIGVEAATTNSEGRFRLQEVPVTSRLVLRLDGEDFGQSDIGPLDVRDAEELDLGDIIVRPGVTISGSVRDQAGLPVGGAEVGLHYTAFSGWWALHLGEPARVVVTDENGDFTIKHARVANYGLIAKAEGYANSLEQARVSQDPDAIRDLFINFTLVKPVRILGRVFGGAQPLEGARVMAQLEQGEQRTKRAGPSYTVTGADGAYELNDLVPGTYKVFAEHPGFKTFGVSIETGLPREDGTIRLPRLGSLSGIVLDENGDPVKRFDIQARKHFRQWIGGVKHGDFTRTSNSKGEFTVTGLEKGFYSLEVWSRGFAVTTTEVFFLKRSENQDGLVVTLGQGATLAGRVIAGGGIPVAGATVSMEGNKATTIDFLQMREDERPSFLQKARTDEDGWFLFEAATPGVYQLRVSHPAHAPLARNDVVVDEGRDNVLSDPLLVTRAGTITGVALSQAGTALASVTVRVNGPGDIFRRTHTNASGEFTFDRLPPGRYTLTVAPGRPVGFTEALGETLKEMDDLGGSTFVLNEGEILHRNVTSYWH